jgi:hypothetical protein
VTDDRDGGNGIGGWHHAAMAETASDTATAPGAAPGTAQAASPTRRSGPPWGTNPWPRRVTMAAVLALAAAIFAYGCNVGESARDDTSHPSVLEQYPAPGGRALRQTEVGAQLEVGFDGRLTVNGIAIPEDQMEGAIDPSSVTPEQLRQFGIRPQNRNRVVFRPGPGKVIEEFEPGEITVTLRYFPDRRDPGEGARTVTWTARVT